METAAATPAASSSADERPSGIWAMLPSFDPAVDDPREYGGKVRFLASICPAKDKGMLAPRLAMLLKGTAWAQITKMDAVKLTDPENGYKLILQAISQWEDTAELQTYEKFEKAIYRVTQKADESTLSFVNRLNVAFQDIEKVSLTEVQAFVMLRQSALGPEDKKRILAMAGGTLTVKSVDTAMRQLAPRVLIGQASGESKKKVYPVNYAEEPEDEPPGQVSFVAEEENVYLVDEEAAIQQMADRCRGSRCFDDSRFRRSVGGGNSGQPRFEHVLFSLLWCPFKGTREDPCKGLLATFRKRWEEQGQRLWQAVQRIWKAQADISWQNCQLELSTLWCKRTLETGVSKQRQWPECWGQRAHRSACSRREGDLGCLAWWRSQSEWNPSKVGTVEGKRFHLRQRQAVQLVCWLGTLESTMSLEDRDHRWVLGKARAEDRRSTQPEIREGHPLWEHAGWGRPHHWAREEPGWVCKTWPGGSENKS